MSAQNHLRTAQVQRVLDREANSAERNSVHRHLRSCVRCQREYGGLFELELWADELVATTARSDLGSNRFAERPRGDSHRARLAVAGWGSLAALLAVGIGLFVTRGAPTGPQAPPAVAPHESHLPPIIGTIRATLSRRAFSQRVVEAGELTTITRVDHLDRPFTQIEEQWVGDRLVRQRSTSAVPTLLALGSSSR